MTEEALVSVVPVDSTRNRSLWLMGAFKTHAFAQRVQRVSPAKTAAAVPVLLVDMLCSAAVWRDSRTIVYSCGTGSSGSGSRRRRGNNGSTKPRRIQCACCLESSGRVAESSSRQRQQQDRRDHFFFLYCHVSSVPRAVRVIGRK